jgi:hypothetical protein
MKEVLTQVIKAYFHHPSQTTKACQRTDSSLKYDLKDDEQRAETLEEMLVSTTKIVAKQMGLTVAEKPRSKSQRFNVVKHKHSALKSRCKSEPTSLRSWTTSPLFFTRMFSRDEADTGRDTELEDKSVPASKSKGVGIPHHDSELTVTPKSLRSCFHHIKTSPKSPVLPPLPKLRSPLLEEVAKLLSDIENSMLLFKDLSLSSLSEESTSTVQENKWESALESVLSAKDKQDAPKLPPIPLVNPIIIHTFVSTVKTTEVKAQLAASTSKTKPTALFKPVEKVDKGKGREIDLYNTLAEEMDEEDQLLKTIRLNGSWTPTDSNLEYAQCLSEAILQRTEDLAHHVKKE